MGVPEDLGWLEVLRGDTHTHRLHSAGIKRGLSLVFRGGNFEGDRRDWPLVSQSGFISPLALQSPALESPLPKTP